MRYSLLAIVIATLFISSCTAPIEPEFIRMDNVVLSDITSGIANITADAIIDNPNEFTVTVLDTDLDVFVNDELVGKVKQINPTAMPASAEFKLPVNIKFDPKKLSGNWLGNAIAILSQKKAEIHYKGKFTVEAAGIKFDLPVDSQYDTEVKLFKNRKR